MIRSLLALIPPALLLLICCSPADSTTQANSVPSPGFDGPVPTGRAQDLLHALEGAELSASGKTWVVGNFGVMPNPRTGKGPVLPLSQGDAVFFLPIVQDGDVVALYERLGRPAPEGVEGDASFAFREALAELDA